MDITETTIKNVLTRTSGFLKTVSSHSLQPYRGCAYGNSLCGVGCYVQHSVWVTKGRRWGSFLEVRTNAADSYLENVERERRHGRKRLGAFGIFMSSATDPFVPQERRYRITESVLEAMCEAPPDVLVVQTHSHRVAEYGEVLARVESAGCDLRVQVSIETDRERIPGLPAPASSVDARFEAAKRLKGEGRTVVVTVSPLLPISEPEAFFGRIADCADAVVIDHFIQGDGTQDGSRTLRTALPAAIGATWPEALELDYRDRMAEVAERVLPGRVGVSTYGFGGRYGVQGG